MEEHSYEKWLTPWKTQVVLEGGNILFIKIKIKCPTWQNLEIMTFRYLQTLTFFFLYYNIMWCFYFWRVLLVITNPHSLWLFDFFPPYTLILPFIPEKLTWPQKILEVSSDSRHCSGGWCHGKLVSIQNVCWFGVINQQSYVWLGQFSG